MTRARPRTSVVSLGVAAIALTSLVVGELTLRVASGLSDTVASVLAPPAAPGRREGPLLPDQRLIHRGNPDHTGHDPSGYRNPQRLGKADVVVLGDSHAYGTSVETGEAWPTQLARLTRRSVYSMALPGYGPGQYALQVDEVLSFRPRYVVLAVYLGNDLFDAWEMAKRHAPLAGLVSVDLRTAADILEAAQPLKPEVNRLFEVGVGHQVGRDISPVRLWMSEHLKLWGLLRAVKRQFQDRGTGILAADFEAATRALARNQLQRKYASAFDDGAWRTILTGSYRKLVVNDGDVRIRTGFEVSRGALRTIARRCREASVSLLVVFKPTKESVFWPRARDQEVHSRLRETVENEERLKRELITSLVVDRVDYLDLLDPLRDAPSQPYFGNADGHPNAIGHQIIAAAVAARLGASPQ